ncbi:hypothetical protein [Ruminococcus sp.]|uniref:hypothetical protein n=1 Tax=Ruminococcus sp. TaxID=41978 RepID=UPI0025E98C91|nr:hypothetical protein [Ruminococcus sp.]MBQ8966208.1 hypothetical protein [Ruminococcus sp.]
MIDPFIVGAYSTVLLFVVLGIAQTARGIGQIGLGIYLLVKVKPRDPKALTPGVILIVKGAVDTLVMYRLYSVHSELGRLSM